MNKDGQNDLHTVGLCWKTEPFLSKYLLTKLRYDWRRCLPYILLVILRRVWVRSESIPIYNNWHLYLKKY